jgi:hypothetical protein
MQKTGSTHVTKVVKQVAGGRTRIRHGQMENYQQYKDRLIVSSVRNPWDWYVSLWAFGCAGSGGLHKYLTGLPVSEIHHAVKQRSLGASVSAAIRLASRVGRRPDWSGLYADAFNEANFRAWLKLVLGAEGRHISKEGYSASAIKSVAGYMTYRFLALTTEYEKWNSVGRAARNYDDVVAFADRHSIATTILRMESLNENLAEMLQSIGMNVSLDELEAIGKTNASTHRKYSDYYDEETHRLVAERDRFIIDRFGYQMF